MQYHIKMMRGNNIEYLYIYLVFDQKQKHYHEPEFCWFQSDLHMLEELYYYFRINNIKICRIWTACIVMLKMLKSQHIVIRSSWNFIIRTSWNLDIMFTTHFDLNPTVPIKFQRFICEKLHGNSSNYLSTINFILFFNFLSLKNMRFVNCSRFSKTFKFK